MGYDIIGDVHGQDGKLTALLTKLGYRVKNGAYHHPAGRMALFLGDLIDTGPGQIEVLSIVRKMIGARSARSIMGNHELNAIAYATKIDGSDDYLRPHTVKNEGQHAEFLNQVGWESDLHKELVSWFKTLPPFLDLGGIRLCHAWWNQDLIDAVARQSKPDGSVNDEFLLASFKKGSGAYKIMEGVTKGMELDLPDGASFTDHAGIERKEVRVRWWDESATTFRKAALVPEAHRERIPDIGLPGDVKLGSSSRVPTFLGHYWLTGMPAIQNAKTAVLDYGAAKVGPLVAYRWDGEDVLSNDNLVWVTSDRESAL